MSLIFQIIAFERVAVGRKYTKLEMKVLIDISPSIFDKSAKKLYLF